MATKDEITVNCFLRVLGGEDYKKIGSTFNLSGTKVKQDIVELAVHISGEIQGDFTVEGFRTKRSFWLNALSNFCESLEKIPTVYNHKKINVKKLEIFKKVVQGATYAKLSEEQNLSTIRLGQIVAEMIAIIQKFIKCAPELDKDFSKSLKISHKKDFKTNREAWLKVINLFEIFNGFLNPNQLI